MGVEERIRTELELLAAEGDLGDMFANVVRKRQRRRIVRKFQFAGLVVAVVAGTLVGTYALSRVFRASRSETPLAPSVSNGIIVFSNSPGESRSPQLFAIEPDGTGLRQLTPEGDASYEGATVSPDGRLVAVVHRIPGFNDMEHVIATIPIEGGSPTWLSGRPWVASDPAWSPDGSRIAFAGSPGGAYGIYVMNADGSDPRLVPGTDEIDVGAPTWSPDGTRIAFEAWDGATSGQENWDVYSVTLDGSGLTDLTNAPDTRESAPAWSWTDGRIAFVRSGDPAQAGIYTMAPDGGDVLRVTDKAMDASPSWSPDGSLILFERTDPNGTPNLYTIRPDGTELAQVTTTGGIMPAWQPLPVTATASPSPEPTATPSAVVTTPPWRDVAAHLPGVGRVCGLTSASGDFVGNGVVGEAFVFEPEPEGGCSGGNENFQYLGIATAPGGPVEIVSPKLTECGVPEGCWVFSTPDVDGDGRAEVAVATAESPYLFFQIWHLVPCGPATDCVAQLMTLEPMSISTPGDPAEGFPPGPAVFRWGGTPDDTAGVRCDTTPQGNPELIEWFTASAEAHFEVDGAQLILKTEVPWDASNPPSLSDLCGAPVSMPGR